MCIDEVERSWCNDSGVGVIIVVWCWCIVVLV